MLSVRCFHCHRFHQIHGNTPTFTMTKTTSSALKPRINAVWKGRRTSSTASSSSNLASSVVTQSTMAPRVISRRSWDSFLQTHKNSGGKTNFLKTPPSGEEKPWPQSVIYTGLVLGGTLIPYWTVWWMVSNETTRPHALQFFGPQLSLYLRRHFGTLELNSISYPEQMTLEEWTQNSSDIPYAFRGEDPWHVRQTQDRIIQEGDIAVRVRIIDNGDDSTKVHGMAPTYDEILSLPRATLANPKQILSSQSTTTKQLLTAASTVAVEFPMDELTTTTTTETASTTTSTTSEMDETDESLSMSSSLSKLLATVTIYSLWHYQPVAPPTAVKGASDRDFRVAELQVLIDQLELELRIGQRDIDSILADLKLAKNQLRKLKRFSWRSWWWW